MVLCKFFQQGTCRFGQYCKFEHSFGNRSKIFGDEKNIAIMVAEDILSAERGGQWLLSCYGPFKERKCIPGMEDVSPEEVRWEMYQAQKNGNADQINVQFQQMCEAMKAKRDALKSPTPAIVQLLEEIQSSRSENSTFGNNSKLNKGNFAFGTPQLGISNANQTSNVFGQKPFGAANNPFGSGNFNSMQATSSIFVRPTTYNANSVFGGKPSFVSAPVFGGPSANGNSIFGGVNKTSTLPFGSVQNAPTFGGLASQGTSIFGGATAVQSGFGQPATFGANSNQTTNSFLKPQGSQSTVFGGSVATPVQPGIVFGGSVVAAGAAPAAAGSAFGANANPSSTPGPGLFCQSTTASAAFGGAPVFGTSTAFGATQAGSGASVFGGQTAFGGTTTVSSSSNVFGGTNTSTSSFGAIAQTVNTGTAFGTGASVATTNAFDSTASSAPFGAPISTAAGPFGALNASGTGPFGGGSSTYSKGVSFGFGATTTTATTSATATGSTTATTATVTTTTTTQSTFGVAGFATASTAGSVFARSTTATAATSNVFMTKSPAVNSPFGVVASTQPGSLGTFATSATSATSAGTTFGISLTVTIDETAYSTEDSLTDDEKAAYRMNLFPEGRIPLLPPTKDLR